MDKEIVKNYEKAKVEQKKRRRRQLNSEKYREGEMGVGETEKAKGKQ